MRSLPCEPTGSVSGAPEPEPMRRGLNLSRTLRFSLALDRHRCAARVGACAGGDEAASLLEELRSTGVPPDAACYHAALRACGGGAVEGEAQGEWAALLYDEMAASQLHDAQVSGTNPDPNPNPNPDPEPHPDSNPNPNPNLNPILDSDPTPESDLTLEPGGGAGSARVRCRRHVARGNAGARSDRRGRLPAAPRAVARSAALHAARRAAASRRRRARVAARAGMLHAWCTYMHGACMTYARSAS